MTTARKPRPAVEVTLYIGEADNTTYSVVIDNAELHISTHGVLVIRRPHNGKAIMACSSGTWHTAVTIGD